MKVYGMVLASRISFMANNMEGISSEIPTPLLRKSNNFSLLGCALAYKPSFPPIFLQI
jgi:hypothetical protein